MYNDDLKRFYPQSSTPEKSNDFVRYNANGEIPVQVVNGGEHEPLIIDALATATQKLFIYVAKAENVYTYKEVTLSQETIYDRSY